MSTVERMHILRQRLLPARDASFMGAGLILMLGALVVSPGARGLFIVTGAAQLVTGLYGYWGKATRFWQLLTTSVSLAVYVGMLLVFDQVMPTWYELLIIFGSVLDIFILILAALVHYLPRLVPWAHRHERLVAMLSVLLALGGAGANLSPAYADEHKIPHVSSSSSSPTSASKASSSRISE